MEIKGKLKTLIHESHLYIIPKTLTQHRTKWIWTEK